MSALITPEPFERLGLRAGLNCSGTNTRYGGARLWPEARAAMVAVAESEVEMSKLNRQAGEHIARLCGAEAGLVSSGAAGGMVLQAAACMTGTDIEKIHRLPNTNGMKNEIAIYRGHRIRYDQAWRVPGSVFVEYGDMRNCDAWEIEQAITPNTAAVAYVVGPTLHQVSPPLDEICRIAHRHEVPVIVDAAAMVPPRANLQRYVDEGADMVVYSGGKGIRGPQGTGVLVGRHDLIEAAAANASPNHGIGRSLKVSKEAIVGLVAALEALLATDEEAEFAHWTEQCQRLVSPISEIPGVEASTECDDVEWLVPSAVIKFGPGWTGPPKKEILAELRKGNPPIFAGDNPLPRTMFVKTMNLSDDEVDLVAHRLFDTLTSPANPD